MDVRCLEVKTLAYTISFVLEPGLARFLARSMAGGPRTCQSRAALGVAGAGESDMHHVRRQQLPDGGDEGGPE